MCSESEPDRHARDAQDLAQEVRRHPAASRHATGQVKVGVQAPREPEPALTSRHARTYGMPAILRPAALVPAFNARLTRATPGVPSFQEQQWPRTTSV